MKLIPIFTSLLQVFLPLALSSNSSQPATSPHPQVLGVQEIVADQPLSDEDSQQVLSAINYQKTLTFFPHHPVAAITPHHLLASHLISGIIQNLPQDKTFILVSPDHFGTIPDKIITTSKPLKTMFGPLQQDTAVQNIIIASGLVADSPEVFAIEHGINSITPFIKHFHPQAQVIPLVIKNTVSYDQILQLAQTVFDACGFGQCFLIASTDFSHNLTSDHASQKDDQTLDLIINGKSRQIFDLTDENLDSPPSLILALKFAQLHGVSRTEVIGHSNSSEIMSDPFAPTTSYFTLLMH